MRAQTIAGALAVTALAGGLAYGVGGLAAVGSPGWIGAGYDVALERMANAGQARGGLLAAAAAGSGQETTLVVGDEHEWIAAPRAITQKAVATQAVGGYGLGDRLVLTVAAKDATSGPVTRTFEVVGIERPVDTAGIGAAKARVVIAREIDAAMGKPSVVRLIVTDGEAGDVTFTPAAVPAKQTL